LRAASELRCLDDECRAPAASSERERRRGWRAELWRRAPYEVLNMSDPLDLELRASRGLRWPRATAAGNQSSDERARRRQSRPLAKSKNPGRKMRRIGRFAVQRPDNSRLVAHGKTGKGKAAGHAAK